MNLDHILEQLRAGRLNVDEARRRIESSTEMDLGFAHVDTDRLRRRGFPEVVFCPGKTPAQIAAIMRALEAAGQNALATRATPEQFAAVHSALPAAVYQETARVITLDCAPLPPQKGLVTVVSAGTADLPVAEEAALTAERIGARVERVYDVGVAGLHRLFRHLEPLRRANAVVVAAGMEGALPSVVGGLISRPVIAVPTSIGYGTSLNGVAALLAMLNTCVPGVTVVNIDNGFGAGVAAALINRMVVGETET